MSRTKVATIIGVLLCVFAVFFGFVLAGWLALAAAAMADVSQNGWYALLAGMLALFTILIIIGCIGISVALFRFAKNSDTPAAELGADALRGHDFESGEGIVPDEILIDTDEEVETENLTLSEDSESVAFLSSEGSTDDTSAAEGLEDPDSSR